MATAPPKPRPRPRPGQSGVVALAGARLLWIQSETVVFLAERDFIRAWRENRP